jgi:hypothetical protein
LYIKALDYSSATLLLKNLKLRLKGIEKAYVLCYDLITMYSSSKTKSIKNNKTKIVVAIVVLIAAIATLVFILERTGTTDFFSRSNTDSTGQTNTQPINYNPPTEDEQTAGDVQKQEIVDNSQKPLPTTAEVVIVDASQYEDIVEVRAFAANVVENGTCTITFTKDTESFSKEVPASADASTSPCIALTVPITEFGISGTWSVAVNYSGSTVTGNSQTTLEIQ